MMQPPKPDVDELETYDQYIGAEFFVNNNGESVPVRVAKRARGNSGKAVGKRNDNPLLDTRKYDCILDDGSEYRYHANMIAENIFTQCHDEGHRHAILKEIADHKKDNFAVDIVNGFVTTRTGVRIPKTTMRGWKLLC